jgi:hypothetical protein
VEKSVVKVKARVYTRRERRGVIFRSNKRLRLELRLSLCIDNAADRN